MFTGHRNAPSFGHLGIKTIRTWLQTDSKLSISLRVVSETKAAISVSLKLCCDLNEGLYFQRESATVEAGGLLAVSEKLAGRGQMCPWQDPFAALTGCSLRGDAGLLGRQTSESNLFRECSTGPSSCLLPSFTPNFLTSFLPQLPAPPSSFFSLLSFLQCPPLPEYWGPGTVTCLEELSEAALR